MPKYMNTSKKSRAIVIASISASLLIHGVGLYLLFEHPLSLHSSHTPPLGFKKSEPAQEEKEEEEKYLTLRDAFNHLIETQGKKGLEGELVLNPDQLTLPKEESFDRTIGKLLPSPKMLLTVQEQEKEYKTHLPTKQHPISIHQETKALQPQDHKLSFIKNGALIAKLQSETEGLSQQIQQIALHQLQLLASPESVPQTARSIDRMKNLSTKEEEREQQLNFSLASTIPTLTTSTTPSEAHEKQSLEKNSHLKQVPAIGLPSVIVYQDRPLSSERPKISESELTADLSGTYLLNTQAEEKEDPTLRIESTQELAMTAPSIDPMKKSRELGSYRLPKDLPLPEEAQNQRVPLVSEFRKLPNKSPTAEYSEPVWKIPSGFYSLSSTPQPSHNQQFSLQSSNQSPLSPGDQVILDNPKMTFSQATSIEIQSTFAPKPLNHDAAPETALQEHRLETPKNMSLNKRAPPTLQSYGIASKPLPFAQKQPHVELNDNGQAVSAQKKALSIDFAVSDSLFQQMPPSPVDAQVHQDSSPKRNVENSLPEKTAEIALTQSKIREPKNDAINSQQATLFLQNHSINQKEEAVFIGFNKQILSRDPSAELYLGTLPSASVHLDADLLANTYKQSDIIPENSSKIEVHFSEVSNGNLAAINSDIQPFSISPSQENVQTTATASKITGPKYFGEHFPTFPIERLKGNEMTPVVVQNETPHQRSFVYNMFENQKSFIALDNIDPRMQIAYDTETISEGEQFSSDTEREFNVALETNKYAYPNKATLEAGEDELLETIYDFQDFSALLPDVKPDTSHEASSILYVAESNPSMPKTTAEMTSFNENLLQSLVYAKNSGIYANILSRPEFARVPSIGTSYPDLIPARYKSAEINTEKRFTQYNLVTMPTLPELDTVSFEKEFITNVHIGGRREDGTYLFSIELEPRNAKYLQPISQNYTFLIDRSGSIDKTRFRTYCDGVAKALNQLKEGDSFNIIFFDNEVRKMSNHSIYYSPSALKSARNFLAAQDSGFRYSSPNISALLLKMGEVSLNSPMHNTVFLLSNGKSLEGFSSTDQNIKEFLRRYKGTYTLFTATASNGNNHAALSLLSKMNKGIHIHSQTNAAFPRKLAALVRKAGTVVAKNVHASISEVPKDSGLTLFPKNAYIPDIYAGKTIKIYGQAKNLCNFELVVQGKAGNEWINIRQKISLKHAEKSPQTFEQEFAKSEAYNLYDRYLEENQVSYLERAREIMSPVIGI